MLHSSRGRAQTAPVPRRTRSKCNRLSASHSQRCMVKVVQTREASATLVRAPGLSRTASGRRGPASMSGSSSGSGHESRSLSHRASISRQSNRGYSSSSNRASRRRSSSEQPLPQVGRQVFDGFVRRICEVGATIGATVRIALTNLLRASTDWNSSSPVFGTRGCRFESCRCAGVQSVQLIESADGEYRRAGLNCPAEPSSFEIEIGSSDH